MNTNHTNMTTNEKITAIFKAHKGDQYTCIAKATLEIGYAELKKWARVKTNREVHNRLERVYNNVFANA